MRRTIHTTPTSIRFPAPVPVDSKVRGKAEVVSIEGKGGGWWEVITRFTLEVEGSGKPCFVGGLADAGVGVGRLHSRA